MKRGIRLAIVLAVFGCSSSDFRTIDPEQRAAVMEEGGRTADALISNLVSHLSTAMAEGGTAAAVDFCSANALPLTAQVASARGLEVKRTSLRYRNPANAPDEHETEALRHFEKVLEDTGELPDAWVQRVGLEEFRYYRPLVVGAPCLKCHGAVEEIDPDVTEILAERYPDDMATGYAAGDFRGLVRVSIPEDRIELPGG